MAFQISARSSAIGALLLAAGCMSGDGTGSKVDFGTGTNGAAAGSGTGSSAPLQVSQKTLLSDQTGVGNSVSTALINPWGIVAYQGMFWIANEGTGKVSIVDGAGVASTGKPASNQLDLGEGITGIAINDSKAMQVSGPNTCGPASLIFGSVHGMLIGVNTDLSMTSGFTLVDNSKNAASYTGVATVHAHACSRATGGPGNGNGSGSGTSTGTGTNGNGGNSDTNCQTAGPVLVLAADFHNGRIDVFDESFKLLDKPMFTVPDLPAGFAPFNVMVFKGTVFVTFAQQDETKTDSVAGAGLGFVAAFDATGKLLWTAKGNELNAPWGLALGADLSLTSNVLLVGNFGDGHITELDLATGAVMAQVQDSRGGALAIEGLWGIAAGVGVQNATANALYFAAGPDDEMHGMFGLLTASPPAPPTM